MIKEIIYDLNLRDKDQNIHRFALSAIRGELLVRDKKRER